MVNLLFPSIFLWSRSKTKESWKSSKPIIYVIYHCYTCLYMFSQCFWLIAKQVWIKTARQLGSSSPLKHALTCSDMFQNVSKLITSRLCACSWGIYMSPSSTAMRWSPRPVAVTTQHAAPAVAHRAVQSDPSRAWKRTEMDRDAFSWSYCGSWHMWSEQFWDKRIPHKVEVYKDACKASVRIASINLNAALTIWKWKVLTQKTIFFSKCW